LSRFTLAQLSQVVDIPLISSGGIAMQLQTSIHDLSTWTESSWLLRQFSLLCEIARQDPGSQYTRRLERIAGIDFEGRRRLVHALTKMEAEATRHAALREVVTSRDRTQRVAQALEDVRALQLSEAISEYLKLARRRNLYLRAVLALEDILDRIFLGATAVQVGTAILAYPGFQSIRVLVQLMEAFFENEVFQELVFQDSLGNLQRSLPGPLVERILEALSVKSYIGLYRSEAHSSEIELDQPIYDIDHSLCAHCGQCLEIPYCNGAIAKVEGEYVIDRQRCTSCGVCAQVCPQGAIYVVEGTGLA
jgi:ferredoxin